MPEPITEKPVVDTEKHNEEIARKLAAQDVMGQSTVLTEASLKDSSAALDKLAAAKENPEPDPTPVPDPKPIDDPAAKEAAEKAEKEAAERKATLEKAEEFFKDAPKLPPNASPKSGEAFSQVKIKAAQEISARDAEIERLKKERSEFEEKLKNPVPPELEQELKDLREWRTKLDVEADPKFKEFDKSIEQAREFIYAQLEANPLMTDAIITEIKKFGGPDMVKIDKLLADLKDPMLQKLVERKIEDIETAKFNKSNAIKAAKANINQYITDRSKQLENSGTQHQTETQKHLNEYTAKFDWLKEKNIDPKLNSDEKKSVEEHNGFVKQTRQNIEAALKDDSPEMRAIMIAGMAQLLNLQRVYDATVSGWEKDKKALKEATEALDKYKNASVSRLRTGSAPQDRQVEVKKDESKIFNTPATQAIDDIAKSIMETRARAAAGA